MGTLEGGIAGGGAGGGGEGLGLEGGRAGDCATSPTGGVGAGTGLFAPLFMGMLVGSDAEGNSSFLGVGVAANITEPPSEPCNKCLL